VHAIATLNIERLAANGLKKRAVFQVVPAFWRGLMIKAKEAFLSE
jgi:hypothetical protein